MAKMVNSEDLPHVTFSDALMKRCKDTLLQSGRFQDAKRLRIVFAFPGLVHYRDQIPEGEDQKDRFERTIAFLLEKGIKNGELVFWRFLRIVSNLEEDGDNLKAELEKCCDEVEQEFSLYKIKQFFPHKSARQWEIVDLITKHFLKCVHMRDKNQRITLLTNCSKPFIKEDATNNKISDFDDVLHFVAQQYFSLYNKAYPNKIEKLAYELYQFENDSPEWIELDKLLCRNFGRVVSYTRWMQLCTILMQVKDWTAQTLKKAYLSSLPSGWPRPELIDWDIVELLKQVLDNLAEVSFQSDNTFPSLEFVEYLIHHAPVQGTSAAQELKEWMDARINDLELNPPTVASLRQRVLRRCSGTKSYLLLTLEKIGNVFWLSAWFQQSENSTPQIIEDHREFRDQKEIPILLDSLLKKCDEWLGDTNRDLSIEVFLTYALLDTNVHHWLIETTEDSKQKSHLGVEYEVVVRSLNRARKRTRSVFLRWRNKWDAMQAVIDGESRNMDDDEKLVYICIKEQAQAPSSFSITLGDHPVACLAFKFSPFDTSFDAVSLFEAIAQAGIPIAFWPGIQTKHMDLEDEWFEPLLSHQNIADLPHLIHKQRRNAEESKDSNHPGHYLTLLWDNPYRLPPSKQAIWPDKKHQK